MASPNAWDIDTYTNPFTPRSPLHLLPRPISHFFGYRPANSVKSANHVLINWAWSFIGAFLGVALIEGVYLHLPSLDGKQAPLIIASFGAAAILEYNTIESPLAQPRNLVFGHFISGLIGVCITKLFHLLPQSEFEKLRWLAGALSVGAASVAMSMTKTVHPPAGATALLCATDAGITELGWWLLPLVLLGAMLMLISALIINNIMRQFPLYWWTPVNLTALRQKRRAADAEKEDVKTATPQAKKVSDPESSSSDNAAETEKGHPTTQADVGKPDIVDQPLVRRRPRGDSKSDITLGTDEIVVPHWFQPNEWELNVLQILQQRLVSVSHDEGPRRSEGAR